MANRRNRQIIGMDANQTTTPSINFNYSENFNRIVELTPENYNRWKTKMLYLLSINNIVNCITEAKVKKIRKKDIKDEISEYVQDEFDDTMLYDKETSNVEINNDITAKWIILNSLGEKTQDIVQGGSKIAFEVWNVLKRSFKKNTNTRKMELRNKLENIKYNTETVINIFLAELQNIINEIEKIDNDIESNTKAGILNRALPENLRFINVFQYKDNWNKCMDYVKNVIPEIISSNLKESTKVNPQNNIYLYSILLYRQIDLVKF